MSLILCLHATAALADTTRKLIVTLDTPHESSPELFCIVGEQRCSERHCSSLSAIEDAMAFDGGGDTITFDVDHMRKAPENEALHEALTALSPRRTSGRGKGQPCSQCTPAVTRVEYMGTPGKLHGYITCTRNRRATNSDQGLSGEGNLVLDSPSRYRTRFHWVVVLGLGSLFPQDQHVNRTERNQELYGSAGAGFELYFERPFSGALELTLLYEPTRTAYGVVRLETDRGDRLARVPYHRAMAELAVTRWGRNRKWQLGLLGGGGFGGPISGDTEKVGTLRSFVFAGALGRIRPSKWTAWKWNTWVELNAGIRWGEKHQFFGTEDGKLLPDTFHGEPWRDERPLLQLYGGLRIRGTIL